MIFPIWRWLWAGIHIVNHKIKYWKIFIRFWRVNLCLKWGKGKGNASCPNSLSKFVNFFVLFLDFFLFAIDENTDEFGYWRRNPIYIKYNIHYINGASCCMQFTFTSSGSVSGAGFFIIVTYLDDNGIGDGVFNIQHFSLLLTRRGLQQQQIL